MNISILIVTKGRPDLLAGCLQSVFRSKALPREVIIVDGSRYKSVFPLALTKSNAPSIVYIHRPDVNLPRGRNIAVRKAKGDIVFFVDDDCRLSPDTLTRVSSWFKKRYIAGVSGAIVNGIPHNVASCVQQAYYDIWLNQLVIDVNKPSLIPNAGLPGLDIASFRRSLLLQFPFHKNVPFGIDEDIDLALRLGEKGYHTYFDPSVAAEHLGRASVRALIKRNFQTGYANEYIKKIHAVDPRFIAKRTSLFKKIQIAKKSKKMLHGINELLFWILFFSYPLSSGIGRIVFRLKRLMVPSLNRSE